MTGMDPQTLGFPGCASAGTAVPPETSESTTHTLDVSWVKRHIAVVTEEC